ncbi:MAG TPA: ribonucleoside triphosphate reductase [Candidatus Latescibacteria bacterium]|nr:ribonucleoside triphosphate reductase [Candidatus Latescibacterota bacterium]
MEVLGWEGGKAKWLRAKAFIRHRVPSPIFLKVRTARGETFISPGHSLFAFRDGRIVPVRPHQLRTSRPNAKVGPEDHVVALGRIPEGCLRNEDSLDLADLISTLPYEAKRNIYVHISEGAFEELERYASRKQALYELGCRYYYDWQEKGMIPFLLWERFGERSDGGVLFSLRNYPEARQERTLRWEKLEAFLTVVACYLTEGKSTATSIVISQRAENLEKLESALEVLGMGTWSSANGRGTSTVVREVGLRGILACLIKHHCGYTASEKRIPYFVYDLSRPFREKFLQDLFEGDGHYDPKAHRYGFSSKSRKMTSGVSLLLASLGKCFVLAPKDRRKGVYGLFYYPEPKRRWPEEGDFVAAPVYEVYEELYPHEWEYDISVESETENFVGGLGGILFHNSPFTNITLDLVPPPTLKDEAVVVGGELRDETYGEFQEEMDMLNRAFAEVMIEGDAQERPFTFPIPTYNVSKDFNWDNPVLDFVFGMTAKYGVPYFANFINSDMKPEDAMSMCCRLRIDRREVKKRGGGLFAANPLTGSIGVVTINLPRIGYLSESEEEFFERLGRLMDVAKVSLEIKRKVVERFTEEGLYPYAKVYLEGVKASTGRYWDNHFSTIGLIGMNEALLNFMGKDIADPEGYEFGVKVLKFMRERLYQYQQETDNLYNLEATPAEGATYRLARLDKTRFPDIVTAGRDGEPYYTNSTHLPVYATEDLYEALKHQDGFQVLYTGGTVLHVFVGERLTSRAVKLLVRRIAENFHIPYYTITPTFSICPAHGYIPGEHPRCPKCGEESEVYSRVVGYLRPVKQWNDGKQTEFRERRHYSVGSS